MPSTTIRISHTAHGAANAPLSIAIDDGLFAAHGLEVVRDDSPSAGLLAGQLSDGGADVVVTSGVPVLRAALRGAAPVVVMSLVARNIFAVLASRSVRSPDDLRGGTLGVTRPGDQDDVVLRRALAGWGIDAESEVTMENLGDRPGLWGALESGRIRAFAVTPPLSIQAHYAGLPILRDFADEDEVYQLGSVVTTRRFAQASPDALRAFLAALRVGVERFQRDPVAAMPHLKRRTGLDDERVLHDTHRVFAAAMHDYAPRAEALAAVRRDLVQATGTSVDVDVARLVDAAFL